MLGDSFSEPGFRFICISLISLKVAKTSWIACMLQTSTLLKKRISSAKRRWDIGGAFFFLKPKGGPTFTSDFV